VKEFLKKEDVKRISQKIWNQDPLTLKCYGFSGKSGCRLLEISANKNIDTGEETILNPKKCFLWIV
jgi:hypothetical protein